MYQRILVVGRDHCDVKMVYIYVCKRFKVTMDMVSSKEGDWVTHLLKHYCKKAKLTAHLERAEINPKKRMTTNSYDSSTDVFKIDLVYKDTKGGEHELKWLIKVSSTSFFCLSEKVNELVFLVLQVGVTS